MSYLQTCPCDSGKRYTACCGPLHSGKDHARTAKQLMRSRYSAFAIGGLGDYLLQTWHPKTRPLVSAGEMGERGVDWLKLTVIDNSQSGDNSMVEFKAYWRDDNGEIQVHHEHSRFMRTGGRWLYVDAAHLSTSSDNKQSLKKSAL